MKFIGTKVDITESGCKRTLSRYQAQNCTDCLIRGKCHKAKENRIVEVSQRLNELREKERELLLSEKGKANRSQRPIDVEPVFGILKHNKGFRRFMLRGIDKVTIEFGLLALAHNLKKMAS